MYDVLVKFKFLDERAKAPEYAHDGDSGADLRSVEHRFLEPGDSYRFRTGIALELPPAYEAQARPRSSMVERGLIVHLGTVDQPYRGEIQVRVTNESNETAEIRVGDKLCQLVIAPVLRALFVPVDELSETSRGTGGFGSTGRG